MTKPDPENPVKKTGGKRLTTAGPGRPPGQPNKTTALLKDAIIKAAQAAGEDGRGKGKLVGYCTFLAKTEPKAFAGLLGKVLPMQVTGEGGGPVQVVIQRFSE